MTTKLIILVSLTLLSSLPAQAQMAQSDQITDDNTGQIIQSNNSTSGKFQPVTVAPSAKSDVSLQFPATQTGKSVIVQTLDGGIASTDTGTIDQSALLAFSFQVAVQPGVYRVMVIDPNASPDSPNIIAVMQFEVDPPQ